MSEITITKTEYELLIRDSERVRAIERVLLRNDFISDSGIKAILGLPKNPQREDKSE
jgi:hypothetical protein